MYHAGFCVLQERVIFQTHAGLLANTLKMKIGSEFSFLLKEGHSLAQAGGLAISAECKNMDYSHSLGALKSNTDQYSFHVLLTRCLMCELISQTCGLPVTTNFLCTTVFLVHHGACLIDLASDCWPRLAVQFVHNALMRPRKFTRLLPCYHGFSFVLGLDML